MDFQDRFALLVEDEQLMRLNQATVMILGIGGVGSYCVEALARSGIGKLILIDSDTVELSNINRQLIALHSTIGQKKVEVMRHRILDISPTCEVVTYDFFYQEENKTVPFLEHKIDFVVDACDSVKSKEMLILECIKRRIPFLVSTGTANRMDPSLLMLTTIDKTSIDPLSRILRKWAKEEKIKTKIPVLWSKEVPLLEVRGKNKSSLGSTSYVPSAAGLLIASRVVQYFLLKREDCS